jgi:hypothetical protein
MAPVKIYVKLRSWVAGGLEVSMTDLHEIRAPKPTAQIDNLGWLFLAIGVVITAVAAIIAYHW